MQVNPKNTIYKSKLFSEDLFLTPSPEKNEMKMKRPISIYEETTLQCNSAKDEAINLRRELELNRDFIEWLFDHSEHCDHISFSDAWDQFETYLTKEP